MSADKLRGEKYVLRRTADGQPIFDSDGILFSFWIAEQLCSEREPRPGYSDMRGPPRVYVIAAVLVPVAILVISYLLEGWN